MLIFKYIGEDDGSRDGRRWDRGQRRYFDKRSSCGSGVSSRQGKGPRNNGRQKRRIVTGSKNSDSANTQCLDGREAG